MLYAGMHKHVGEQLIQMEVGHHEEMQSEDVIEINAHTPEDECGKKHQYVYNQQVLCYRRNVAHIVFIDTLEM